MDSATRYVNFASGETISFSVSRGDQYIAATDDALSLVGQIQENLVASSFRIFVLYDDETINFEIPQTDIKMGGSYSENYQNGQRRTLSFTLYNQDGRYTPGINTLMPSTRLRFEMGVELGDGRTIWFSKGVFVVNSVNISQTSQGDEVAVSAGDKFTLFEGNAGKLNSTYEIPVGTSILEAMQSILLGDMGNGSVFDPRPITMDTRLEKKVTQSTISKENGDTFSSILQELATQLGAEVFYNATGSLTVTPISEVSDDRNKPVLCTYQTDTDGFSQLGWNIDYSQVINRVIVIGTPSSGSLSQATAVNDDPASPFCYQRVGYRTGNLIRDSNITSNILAQERADYELRQAIVLKTTTSANVLFNPILEVNNLIAITDDFFDMSKARFLLQGITCPLDYSNQMSITFSNISNLPFLAR